MTQYISVKDATRLILPHLNLVANIEQVGLDAAAGRVLAQSVSAPRDWPPFRRAAMDGYAFRAQETPGTLHVVGTLFAGQTWPTPVNPGEALRIMTGAPVPLELDTVLEQEAVQAGDNIAVLKPVKPDRNIMAQGHEYQAHTPILAEGTRLTPIALGQLAGLGLNRVAVRPKPKILIIVTGDEVLKPGAPLSPGHIYDASGPLIKSLAEELGAYVKLRYIHDSKRRLLQALKEAHESFNLVITTGSVSVGLRDYLPHLLEEHFQRLFWRVDMHPGKAMAAGVLRPGLPILALSGNPGATLTGWYLIGAPIISALNRQAYELKEVQGRLSHPYPKPTRETRYLKARFVQRPEGLNFDLAPNQSADVLSSFAQADGLVIIPYGSPGQEAGQQLKGLLFPGKTVH